MNVRNKENKEIGVDFSALGNVPLSCAKNF